MTVIQYEQVLPYNTSKKIHCYLDTMIFNKVCVQSSLVSITGQIKLNFSWYFIPSKDIQLYVEKL